MIFRITLLATLLIFGAWSGGWWGLFAMFLFSGFLYGLIFPMFSLRPRQEATGRPGWRQTRPDAYEYVPARKGVRIEQEDAPHRDPTRPRR